MWVASSNLESIWYNRERKILTVAFHGGRAYRYYHVPEHKYESLRFAFSKGKFLHQYLKGRYLYHRIR